MPKIAIAAAVTRKGSAYPEPFRQLAQGRFKRVLGDVVGLSDFGVNLVSLPPGAWSSQRHWHTEEDEFVYVLEGELTLIEDAGETILRAGDCAGFPKGRPDGHHLINRSAVMATYLEVGARAPADVVEYPDIDMRSLPSGYVRKDGTPY